jgi:hypothetical protein
MMIEGIKTPSIYVQATQKSEQGRNLRSYEDRVLIDLWYGQTWPCSVTVPYVDGTASSNTLTQPAKMDLRSDVAPQDSKGTQG